MLVRRRRLARRAGRVGLRVGGRRRAQWACASRTTTARSARSTCRRRSAPGAAFFDYRQRRPAGPAARERHRLARAEAPAGATPRLYRNDGRGTFADVTTGSGLDGPAVRDGRRRRRLRQRRLARRAHHGRRARTACSATPATGRFVDVTATAPASAAAPGFSTSALWFDYDRDGWLDLLVCNYVRWTPRDRRLLQRRRQAEGRTARRRRTAARRSWLFRNQGDGTFEDVTAKAGLFDATSKSLGVTLLDYDLDGWPDVFVANDTQPNKLYRNNGNGTFTELGAQGRRSRSARTAGRAPAWASTPPTRQQRPPVVRGHATSRARCSACTGRSATGSSRTGAASDVGRATRHTLGFGCFFFDVDLDGLQDLLVVNGHIDDTLDGGTRPRHLRRGAAPVPQRGRATVRGHRAAIGGAFAAAEGGPRRRVRRHRPRRRPRRARHDQRRAARILYRNDVEPATRARSASRCGARRRTATASARASARSPAASADSRWSGPGRATSRSRSCR